MSGSNVVAILGRPLRSNYCSAFLATRPLDDSLTLIAPNSIDLKPYPSTVTVVLHAQLSADDHLPRIWSRFRTRLLQALRSGSSAGVRIEAWLKRSRRWWSRLPRNQEADPFRPWDTDDAEVSVDQLDQELISLLNEIQSRDTIDLIAVFDVFVLPEVIAFAGPHTDVIVV